MRRDSAMRPNRPDQRFGISWLMLAAACCLAGTSAAMANEPAEISDARRFFQTQVRPILANHCWSCHGPDESARQVGLRLDQRETALTKSESGKLAIVPGKPDASEVIARIESHDPDKLMPPMNTKKPLSESQKKTLRQWIASGAEYSQHWAFVAPQRPAVPKPTNRNRGTRDSGSFELRNPIDAFVLKRLEDAGCSPSREADRATWLRRVTLDLTGLPTTTIELETFLADKSDDVHERVVDRMLASPRSAERLAMQWLDAARYADTNGYNNDEVRTMWPWRDWVIDAFRRGLPYDQFVAEQLAGDLLPNATLAQRVATGFNRNHVLTTEGGIIEEEYHVEYVADRVHTTASVFMGLTLQCARCHDHKYDPLTQRDYYQFAAFFNNIPDKVVGYSQGRMASPLLKVPSPEQTAALQRLERRRVELEQSLKQRKAGIDVEVARWEQSLTAEQVAKLGPPGLVARFTFDEADGAEVIEQLDSSRRGTIHGKAARVPGKLGGALDFDGNTFITFIDAGQIGIFDSEDKVSFATWIQPTSAEPTTVLSKMDEANAHRGYDVIMEGGKVASHWVHHWPDSAFKVITKEPVSLKEWHHVVVTYDGSRKATGVKIYVDGKPQPLEVTTNNTVSGTLHTDKPFHIGRRNQSAPFQGRIDDVQIFSLELTAEDAANLASGQSLERLKEVLAVAPDNRTETQRSELREFYLDRIDAQSRNLKSQISEIPRQLAEIDKAIPSTMVMEEMSERRPTYLLRRGQYDQRGEQVSSRVPQVLASDEEARLLETAGGLTRLDLARWLTSPDHPLTARVAVNRWWEMLFGTGLVETSEDFGVQGALPSHPELLDWLATEYIRTGWDTRAMLKLIVMSATYRQSSAASQEGERGRGSDGAKGNAVRLPLPPPPSLPLSATNIQLDPHNRLLARGPRYRLPAETVRDNALAVSGLLRERLGGPSVKPYQPEGLWEDVSVERREKYVPDSGDSLYRRSMYTFWKRTSPPPGMSTFDAPDREFCVVRRSRTNTPLQALVLLNDPTFVEAARKLAERVTSQSVSSDEARLNLAFQIVLSRTPTATERDVLLSTYRAALDHFRRDTTAAEKLLNVGASPRDSQLDAAELAAWTTITSLILNLDEAISKT